MAVVSYSLKGIKELQARFKALDDLGPIMRDLALTAVGEQKRLAPVKTGNLRRTIHVGRVTDRSAETIASAEYAAYVEFGTKPHEIRPRNRRVLRWKDAQGTVRFARRVRHPGTKAQPYMIPGAERAVSDLVLRDKVIDKWNNAA
jgi:hypothetical protein